MIIIQKKNKKKHYSELKLTWRCACSELLKHKESSDIQTNRVFDLWDQMRNSDKESINIHDYALMVRIFSNIVDLVCLLVFVEAYIPIFTPNLTKYHCKYVN